MKFYEWLQETAKAEGRKHSIAVHADPVTGDEVEAIVEFLRRRRWICLSSSSTGTFRAQPACGVTCPHSSKGRLLRTGHSLNAIPESGTAIGIQVTCRVFEIFQQR